MTVKTGGDASGGACQRGRAGATGLDVTSQTAGTAPTKNQFPVA